MFQGRAKRKIDELAHLLDVAKMNYRQLGGVLDEDQKKQEEERESARLEAKPRGVGIGRYCINHPSRGIKKVGIHRSGCS